MAMLHTAQANEIALAFLKALGIDEDRVTKLTIVFECNDVPRVTVERLLGEEAAGESFAAAVALTAALGKGGVTVEEHA